MPAPDAYLICATPRTGSTLLCGLLRSTGVAGVPESYFREQDRDRWADRWRLPRGGDGSFSEAAFVQAAVREGSTGNGVFGARVMWGSMEPLVARLADTAAGHRSDLELLSDAFGSVRFVHLRREDQVGQAVSWARAEQSGYWHPGDAEPAAGPRFDADLVDRLVRTIDEHDARWRAWFAATGVVPHQVTYEQLVADPAGVTEAVLDHLGLALPPGWRPRPLAGRQADAVNAEWVQRYLAWRRAR